MAITMGEINKQTKEKTKNKQNNTNKSLVSLVNVYDKKTDNY